MVFSYYYYMSNSLKVDYDSKLIYLVEDERSLSSAIIKKLERKGYRTKLFIDGNDVYDQALVDEPALILLDILLPTVDGLDVLSKIRKDDKTKNIPVIMLSNLNASSPKILRTTTNYPPHLYLVKSSWTLSALMDQISSVLSNKDA